MWQLQHAERREQGGPARCALLQEDQSDDPADLQAQVATLKQRLACLTDAQEFASSVCDALVLLFAGLVARDGIQVNASRPLLRWGLLLPAAAQTASVPGLHIAHRRL